MCSSNSCVVCGYSISDPVCGRCYIKQTGILLKELNPHETSNEIILRKIKNKFPTETLNDSECILCKKDNLSLCLYCFYIMSRNLIENCAIYG